MSENEFHVTQKEAADFLQVSTKSISRYRKRGLTHKLVLNPVTGKQEVRFRRADLERWDEGRQLLATYGRDGEEQGGGRCRPSILADATESVFAAVYLDGGMDAASDLIHRVLLDKEREEQVEERRRDYKTELQELVQRKSDQLLRYELTGSSGPDHAKEFAFRVTLNGAEIGTGTGRSKKEAEQSAACAALEHLKNEK